MISFSGFFHRRRILWDNFRAAVNKETAKNPLKSLISEDFWSE